MSALPEDVRVLGRPIKGPSAFSGDLRRFANLTFTIAFQDFKLRFFGSALGYLWQLMRPLMLFGVLYVIFTQVVKLNAGTRFFAVVLLTNIVIYTFFSEATQFSVQSLVHREQLLRKIEFPRLVVPLSVVLTSAFNLLLNFLVITAFGLISGVRPHLTWLELPVLLILLAVFTTGVAMLLSALYPRFRDIQPIWEVSLQILFYASPIFYTIERVAQSHARLAHIMLFNPLAAIMQQVRHAVIDPSAPGTATAIGGWERMAIPLAIAVGVFALGLWVFAREAPRVAEVL